MKYYHHILPLILLVFSFNQTFATAQVPDKLIYKGDTISIYASPLEQLYKNDSIRPELFGLKDDCGLTSCWRGYQAEWTIINNEIYLTGIYSCCFSENKNKADLKKLFGDKFINGAVKAFWVTGNFISPQGKLLYYVHADYNSIYEKEIEFQFKNGKLIESKVYDNSKSRTSIYREDQKKLNEFIYKHINWEILTLNQDKITIFIQFSANSKEIIDSAKILRGYSDEFDKEAIRVIKTIPKWDILYSRGKLVRMNWVMPITFNEDNRRKYGRRN